MLRKQLADKGYVLTNEEFAVVAEIVTDDIKFNRTSFKKRTNINEVVELATRTINVLRRCA
jgi:hypothetical protein